MPAFLPISGPELRDLGRNGIDVLLVSGDAYVDHPSFGTALLGRWLEAHGFSVGIVAQPPWEDREAALAALRCMGRPRLFAGVTAGAIDSMLAHYTAFRKKRRDDAYTPGGAAGARPNRAAIVYTGLVRQAFPGMPVVLGGIEASLRRLSHYDFWSDSLRRPLLLDSKADLLVYGMGENALLAIARAAAALAGTTGRDGVDRAALVRACAAVPGLAWSGTAADVFRDQSAGPCPEGSGPLRNPRPAGDPAHRMIALPAHQAIVEDPKRLMEATLAVEQQVHRGRDTLFQEVGDRYVVLNPPAPPLSTSELDRLYGLPYTRLPHPSYTAPIPAWEMIRTSITTHRGCGGGCSFCSLALHQGRKIASRSRESVVAEARAIAAGPGGPGSRPPRWAGSISDVGGPSANMWQARCALPADKTCSRSSCMHPEICALFRVNQQQGVELMREVAAQPGIRHVRVASGVRFDLALRDSEALFAYTSEFTGGQLKVAPEHAADEVLALMRKPSLRVFERFLEAFAAHCHASARELYTVPYLMSAFPGCTDAHMRALGDWLRRRNWQPRQVQCFIPTPGTVATAMFYGGISPDGAPLYVARSDKDRLRQHYLLTGGPEDRKKRPSAEKKNVGTQAAQPAPDRRRPPGPRTTGPAGKPRSRPGDPYHLPAETPEKAPRRPRPQRPTPSGFPGKKQGRRSG